MALNQILGLTKLKYEYGMLLMPTVVKKQQFVGKPDLGITSIWSQETQPKAVLKLRPERCWPLKDSGCYGNTEL